MFGDSNDNRSILRSLLTAAATGAGVVGGAGAGAGLGVLSGRNIMRRGRDVLVRSIAEPTGAPASRGAGTMKLVNKALGAGAKAVLLRGILGAALGATGGGIGMYQLAKRKKKAMEAPTREQLLNALKATAGGASVGGLIGAGIGSVGSNPDPERGRLIHILRMILKGAAIGGGTTAGALAGGYGAGTAAKGIGEGTGMGRMNTAKLTSGATLAGALAGGGAGGALGSKLGAEKRAALAYILRGHLKQAMLEDLKAAVRGR